MRTGLTVWMIGMSVATSAMANVVTLNVRATTSTTVAPGGTVDYEITAMVDTGDNNGLATFVTFLLTNYGVAQDPVTGFGPELASGWGLQQFGDSTNDDVYNIAAGQTNFGNFTTGIGQPGPVVLAFGTLVVPDTEGTYTVVMGDNPTNSNEKSVANTVPLSGPAAMAADVQFGNGFNITVQQPADNTGGDNTGGDNTGGDNTGGSNTGGDNTGNTGGDTTGGGDTGGTTNSSNNTSGSKGPCGAGIATAVGGSFLMLCIVRIGRRRYGIVG